MRVKTDERREAIASAAWQVFRENGFERTTISAVVTRAGGSKATIYGYFESKDELFAAAQEQGLEGSSEEPLRQLAKPGPLAERLLRFARADLKSRLSPDMIAVERMLVAEADRSHVYEVLREKSFLRRRLVARRAQASSERLREHLPVGRLRVGHPISARGERGRTRSSKAQTQVLEMADVVRRQRREEPAQSRTDAVATNHGARVYAGREPLAAASKRVRSPRRGKHT